MNVHEAKQRRLLRQFLRGLGQGLFRLVLRFLHLTTGHPCCLVLAQSLAFEETNLHPHQQQPRIRTTHRSLCYPQQSTFGVT